LNFELLLLLLSCCSACLLVFFTSPRDIILFHFVHFFMTSLLLTTEISKVSETLLAYSKNQSIADKTSNRSPFTEHVFPQLSQLVDKITTFENLRTSKDVIKLLQNIIDQCVATILVKCWKTQSIKPRLDAMMKMAVPFLCTPLMTSILNIGEYVSCSLQIRCCVLRRFYNVSIVPFQQDLTLHYCVGHYPVRRKLLIALKNASWIYSLFSFVRNCLF
jgi:hypothetical protein